MLIRISLILAILAGLAVGTLNFIKVKEKITTLQANLAEQTSLKEKALTELASTKSKLKKTETVLKQTKAELDDTTKQRDVATAKVEELTKKSDDLAKDLEKTRTDLDTAKADLEAYRRTELTPPQILAIDRDYRALQKTLANEKTHSKELAQVIDALKTKLARYENEKYIVTMSPSIRGKVLVTDPKWNFVVLDVGQNQGVKQAGEMLVNRSGKLVAKVIVQSLQKDRSIANVMPGWQLGDILEGDQAIPAHPADETVTTTSPHS